MPAILALRERAAAARLASYVFGEGLERVLVRVPAKSRSIKPFNSRVVAVKSLSVWTTARAMHPPCVCGPSVRVVDPTKSR